MTNSSVNGTIWYKRQVLKKMPMHSYGEKPNYFKTQELYTVVSDEKQSQVLINELRQNGIDTDFKKLSSDGLQPSEKLIVFAELSNGIRIKSQRKNIIKLKSYILANGGKIDEEPQKNFIRHFLQNLFGRR